MAKENNKNIISEEYVGGVIYDAEGKEQFRQGIRSTESEVEGGKMSTERISENSILDNGMVWNVSLMARPGKDAIFVGQCPICVRRFRLRHHRHGHQGLSTLTSMKRCFSCGLTVCSKHFVLSNDNHIRCRRCNWKYFLVHRILKPIFFKEVS